MQNKNEIIIVGPTAVGKSAIAIRVAEAVDGEIISVDSMQVYRGMDIGTAKSSAEDRERVRHHLIDVMDLSESFDAAQFVARVNAVLPEIESRGKRPIFCGGTGLYLKAWLEGLGSAPPADPELRATLEATPLPDLLQELAQKDPAAHTAIDQNNPRRVVRAVEVIRLTGKPFSEQRADWESSEASKGPHPGCFGLRRNMMDRGHRITQRVKAMFDEGLVEETRRLIDAGLKENPTASQAIGYRQVIEHLDGERSLPQTIELVMQKTRQYAHRQMNWFRNQAALNWLGLSIDDTEEAVTRQIMAALKAV